MLTFFPLEQSQEVPIKLSVINGNCKKPAKVYTAIVKPGGVLLGAMRRLQKTNQDFK